MIKLLVLLTLAWIIYWSFDLGYTVARITTPKVPVINSCKAIPACFQ